MLPSLVHEFVGQALYVVRTCPRVDLLTDESFLLDVDLRVTSDTSGEVGRQSNRFVEGVGVERLRVPEGCTHSFDTRTTDVVEGILLRK